MKILGIETSCDETAAAVVEDGATILSNQVASQVEIHARYGGIVPEVASRQHILAIIPIIEQAMTEAGVEWGDIDGIAVTAGPGLAGSLLIGVNTAKAISMARDIPLTGVNHLEGHIYANWINRNGNDTAPEFPLLSLIVSDVRATTPPVKPSIRLPGYWTWDIPAVLRFNVLRNRAPPRSSSPVPG